MAQPVCSPTKTMSECWQDDKRMNALFLPFRKKELNPVDWDSKMKFWYNAIETWTIEKNDCIISVKKLQKEFKRKDRVPLCLGTVFEELSRNGDIKERDDFTNDVRSSQKSWSRWAVESLFKASVGWSFTKLKGVMVESDTSETLYVYLHWLKVRGGELLFIVKEQNKSLMSLDELEQLLKEIEGGIEGLAGEQLRMVIDWLVLQRQATLAVLEGKTLVKFSLDENKDADSITEADTALLTLKKNRDALIKNLETLEAEKQEAIEETKTYLRKGMRHAAKSSLRKKKELEKCITKRSNALDNTETLLSRIRDAESDAQLLQAYKMGLSALKTTFKNAGLTEDSVTSTMDEVHEVIDIHDEIQFALSESVSPNADDELERELADLLELPSTQTNIQKPTPQPDKKLDQSFVLPDLPEAPANEIEELKRQIKELDLLTE